MHKKIKVLLLFLFCAGLLAVTLTSKHTTRTVQAFAEGPPAGRTGAPGELTCDTSGCHNSFPLNSGGGQFSVKGPVTYTPGQTYQIMVTHMTSDTSRRRWGFELTALDSNNKMQGNLSSTDSLTQVLNNQGPGNARQYIEHTMTGTFDGQMGGASWTFNWTAPASDAGPITFYAAGNQANGDGTPSGDEIYTTTAMTSTAPTGPPTVSSVQFSGKRMILMGGNYELGAKVLLNGARQKTANDGSSPTTTLICKKAGRLVVIGASFTIEVVNPDGSSSGMITFTRNN